MSRLVNVSKPEHHDYWVDPSRVISVYSEKINSAGYARVVVCIDGNNFYRNEMVSGTEATAEVRRIVGLLYPVSLAAHEAQPSLPVDRDAHISPRPMVPAGP